MVHPVAVKSISPVARTLGIALALALLATALGVFAHGDGALRADVRIERFIQRAPHRPAHGFATIGNAIGSARWCAGIMLLAAIALSARRQWSSAVLVVTAYAIRATNA